MPTAAALFNVSVSTKFRMLCLWAIPYGLGTGAIDSAINNYVALQLGIIIILIFTLRLWKVNKKATGEKEPEKILGIKGALKTTAISAQVQKEIAAPGNGQEAQNLMRQSLFIYCAFYMLYFSTSCLILHPAMLQSLLHLYGP